MRTTKLPRLVNPNHGGNTAQAQGLKRTIAALQAARLQKQAKRNTTNAAAAPVAACVASVIRLCVEISPRNLSIRHDRMLHSHACFRGSAAVPHASEQTRILPEIESVEVASDE